MRARADELVERIHYVDLTTHPLFTDFFVQSLRFEEEPLEVAISTVASDRSGQTPLFTTNER